MDTKEIVVDEGILDNHHYFIAEGHKKADYNDMPPITRKLRGIISVPDDYDWKEDRADSLIQKHMK